jgi:hypothetical protein
MLGIIFKDVNSRFVDINNHKLSLFDTPLHRTSNLVQFYITTTTTLVVVVVVAVVVYHTESLYTHLSPVTTTSCYRAKFQETVKIHSPTNMLNLFQSTAYLTFKQKTTKYGYLH